MLRSCSRKVGGVAAFRPKRKEREFLRLGERTEIGIVLQDFAKRAVELGAGDSREIWQCKIVTTDPELSQNATDFGTTERSLGQHARKNAAAFRPRPAQRFPPRGRGQDGLRCKPNVAFRQRKFIRDLFEKTRAPEIGQSVVDLLQLSLGKGAGKIKFPVEWRPFQSGSGDRDSFGEIPSAIIDSGELLGVGDTDRTGKELLASGRDDTP